MNPVGTDIIKCVLCGETTRVRGFDHALQGPVGTCCHEDLRIAAAALAAAEFTDVTHNPEHEK